MTRPKLKLVRPAPSELDILNALILRSKAFWGYDEAFMKACERELKVTAQLLDIAQFITATLNGRAVGVAEVSIERDTAHLEKLFVDPDHMDLGAGRLLFEWAAHTARAAGAAKLMIEADPGAEPFYKKMGAVKVGQVQSGSIPGRLLPELEFCLR